jgi:hypothetical protein
MKAPTEKEIREEVYSNTFNETSEFIESFINGAIWMARKWANEPPPKPYIYERDEDKIYRRGYGTDTMTRELL